MSYQFRRLELIINRLQLSIFHSKLQFIKQEMAQLDVTTSCQSRICHRKMFIVQLDLSLKNKQKGAKLQNSCY